MRRLLTSQEIPLMVGNVGTLPSFPKAFQEISSCLKHPSATVADAARIIGRDVAMTANIMKLVNSAFFGARRHVSSVDRAVAFLGLDTLTALVLGHGLFQSGGSNATEALWLHSFRTAIAARAIALHERLPAPRVDEAFLTGMLHDVGRVVFANRKSEVGGTELKSSANTLMHVDKHHAEVGAYLLGLWGFPSHIVAAVALHHTPSQRADAGFDLTAIVHVADRLVHRELIGNLEAGETGIEPGLLEGLGLADHLPQWSKAINLLEVQQQDQERTRQNQ
jgi:HD-like signal output (HDOD) protein